MILQRDFIGELTPLNCRKGPIMDRKNLTDFYCCILYLVLVGVVVLFMIFSYSGFQLDQEQARIMLKSTQFGGPLYALGQAFIPIILSLALITAICMIFMITSLIIPSIVAYVYLPLIFVFVLIGAVIFALRYFGITLPCIPENIQKIFSKSQQISTLLMGLIFSIGVILAIFIFWTKKTKFSYIGPVLRMARVAFWSNSHIIIFCFIFSALSIIALAANTILIGISLTKADTLIGPALLSTLITIQAIWTHGLILSLSDFFFQSIALHWYFKKRRQFQKKQIFFGTLLHTFRLISIHIGTISCGFIFTFFPQILNNFIGKLQKYKFFYTFCCFWHNTHLRWLSKFGYFQTIFQGFSFCEANKEMFGLRQRTKKILPNIYMIGNFYITLVKVCSIIIGIAFCYFLIQNTDQVYLTGDLDFLGPLVMVLFGGLQISSHFMNLTGLVGDTLIFAYSCDLQIQKRYFGGVEPPSCPHSIKQIIYQVKAGKDYIK